MFRKLRVFREFRTDDAAYSASAL